MSPPRRVIEDIKQGPGAGVSGEVVLNVFEIDIHDHAVTDCIPVTQNWAPSWQDG